MQGMSEPLTDEQLARIEAGRPHWHVDIAKLVASHRLLSAKLREAELKWLRRQAREQEEGDDV